VDEQRVALVTGAASGIGRAIALEFAGAGFSLAVADRDEEGLKDLARELEDGGTGVLSKTTNVEVGADLDGLTRVVIERFGRLDSLLQIAGIGCYRPFWEVSDDEAAHVFAVNVWSQFALAKRCTPLLRESRGTIVNMASVRAFRGGPELAIYSASKGAIVSLTRSMAHELGPFGIRVNALCPGTIDTPLLERYVATQKDPAAFKASLHSEQPLGRIGTPKDVAAAALYLATPASEWITGIALTVDGGLTA
jgi:NAD(P)-dependent dehydrogenase (short-subunit alcohol dehydrogenase family)